MKQGFKVGGMSCVGCVRSIEQAFSVRSDVKAVMVDLKEGMLWLEGDITREAVAECLENLGFDLI